MSAEREVILGWSRYVCMGGVGSEAFRGIQDKRSILCGLELA
jgi:hypothetical protein